MISFESIRKSFGALDVLKGVNLAVRPGSVTALVGPNASGKTTLIKIALGLARADAGRVSVGGESPAANGDYRRLIGYMPQIARFPENLRIRDVLELIAALRPGAVRDEFLVRAFNLDADGDKPLGTLSGGTRQKVNAAIAFLFRPPLLILDEPTAGLDPVSSGVLKARIRSARDDGRTVIITSHVLTELEDMADDIAFLCDGVLQFAGPVPELLATTGEARLEAAVAALMRADALRRPAAAAHPAFAAPELAPLAVTP